MKTDLIENSEISCPNTIMTESNCGRLWRKYRHVFFALMVACLTILVFAPARHYDFLALDDGHYVKNNPYVQSGLTIEGTKWALTTVHEQWWLPLLWLSYMVDTEIFGSEPYGYHLTNILLHALSAGILFIALFRMTNSLWRSAFAVALFAWHPLRLESVVWIAARKDTLSGLFFVLCLWGYSHYARSSRRFVMWGITGLMLLGLMSKAIVIIVPFILLLLDYWPLRRAGIPWHEEEWPRWKSLLLEKTPLFLLTLVFVIINIHTHTSGIALESSLSLGSRISLIFPNYWVYIRNIFWPFPLSVVHQEFDVINWPLSLLSAFGLIAVSAALLATSRKAPYLIVGWLWFLLGLFPIIRGVRMGLAAHADRFAYLPAIGAGIALVWGGHALLAKCPRYRLPLAISLGTLILSMNVLGTRIHMPLYKNSYVAFRNVLQQYPDNPLVNNSFAVILLEERRIEEALPHLERAVAGNRRSREFTANLMFCLIHLNRPEEALRRYRGLLPSDPQPETNRLRWIVGLAYTELNQPHQAIPYLEQAASSPGSPLHWRMDLARAHRDAGNAEAERMELQRLAEAGFLHTHYPDHFARLWQNGHSRRAWTFFQREIERDPDNPILLNNTAWLLATDPPVSENAAVALPLALRAKELDSSASPHILNTVAVAFAATADFEQALVFARKALAAAVAAGNHGLATKIEERIQTYASQIAE